MNDTITDCYIAALGAMTSGGPRNLISRAQLEAADRECSLDVSFEALASLLEKASINDSLRKRIHVAIAGWDVAPKKDPWADGTDARTAERRILIYARLGLPSNSSALSVFDVLFPIEVDAPVVISDEFIPWYSEERRKQNAFYWPRYIDFLEAKGWSPEALAGIDQATTQVIERLTDPQRAEARQAKGLVVGYVQSGKTANFAGVTAKAIDAGYRLIIVLAGTINVLRQQTQRRMDMEVIGRENIIGGVDPSDPGAMSHVDYQNDEDWPDKFLSFGFLPSTKNLPDVIRLTGASNDYTSLKSGIAALEYDKADKTKPLFAPENLPRSSARVVIVKKNKSVLKNLVRDLKSIKTARHEIPTLIIDDESDQASVNTSNPDTWHAGQVERTGINQKISELLRLLPRAQYVGYTATPFANVFVDPSDSDDIFPKDFLISLPRPFGYMGVSDFHDLDSAIDRKDRTVANSNEKAHVRTALDEDASDDAESGSWKLQQCIDAFVLTGAIKLYRSGRGEANFKHHTMLVHASVAQADHLTLANSIRDIWKQSSFTALAGLKRLKALYESDFLPVSRARAGEYSFPESFDDLHPFVSKSVTKIVELGDPVIIVNGDEKMALEDVDFDKRSVWRILVGGTKLSRGFTVEGLTISYYRRKTKQADTLIQMGRWFGFRPGFQDLVRLCIGRSESDGKGTIDLYEAFEAIVEDEEAFRSQLRQYSELVDGYPQLTPRDIPPLVSQHLPWLKPAAKNKMFNAELVIRRSAGSLVIPAGYPPPSDSDTIAQNFNALEPIFAAASTEAMLIVPEEAGIAKSTFKAFIGSTDTLAFLEAIERVKWISKDYYAAEKAFLREVSGQIEQWVIIAPQASNVVRDFNSIGVRSISKRGLKPPLKKLWGEPTDRKHRPAPQYVSGNYIGDYDDPTLKPLRSKNVGAALIYAVSPNPQLVSTVPVPGEVVLAIAWITPAATNSKNRPVVQFQVKNAKSPNAPIVDLV